MIHNKLWNYLKTTVTIAQDTIEHIITISESYLIVQTILSKLSEPSTFYIKLKFWNTTLKNISIYILKLSLLLLIMVGMMYAMNDVGRFKPT